MGSAHFLKTITELSQLVGLSEDTNPIDIKFTKPKVKVTMVTFVKKLLLLIILRTNYLRAFIFHS